MSDAPILLAGAAVAFYGPYIAAGGDPLFGLFNEADDTAEETGDDTETEPSDTDVWWFEGTDDWDDMTVAERCERFHEERHLKQVKRQYEAQDKSFEDAFDAVIDGLKHHLQRTRRKLKANPFWREDYE